MGKRKKATRKPQGKKNEPLATVFTCLFCNHENSVSVKIDKKAGVGNLECKTCGQKFQCGINYLSAPIDVYSEWVDAADAVAQGQGAESQSGMGGRRLTSGRPGMSSRKTDDYDEETGYADADADADADGIVADDDDYE